jgi:hypothetical protein
MKSGGEEESFNLLKNNNFNHNDFLDIIPINVDLKRKLYLYKKISKFVDVRYRDIHFSNPNSNVMQID